MKKKKQETMRFGFITLEESEWKALMVILIIICLGVVTFFTVTLLNKPNYKITINGCYNETIYIPQQCFYDENTSYVKVKECLEREPDFIQVKKEVCEDREVDYIPSEDGERYCKTGSTIDCIKIIKKSEITKEWLLENCKCIQNKICTDYNVQCQNRCSKYKCGNYEVEV